MKHLSIVAALALTTSAAFADGHAQGDAAAGEEAFGRQCIACHVIVDDEGNKLAGRNAKSGPNLYGLPGRAAGSREDYRYGKSIVEAGESGVLVWDEASFVDYVQDPTGYLRKVLDDSKARGKMAFKVRKEADAFDMWAFIVSLSPEVEADEDADEGS